MSHLTRKEIKRDELTQALGRTVDYASSHSQLLLKGLIAVVAVAAVAGLTFLYLRHRGAQAGEALAGAMLVYGAEINPTTPKPDDPAKPSFRDEASRRAKAKELFESVRSRYGGTEAGRVAKLYLGRIAAEQGDLTTARREWQDALEGAPRDVLASALEVNLLKLDLAQGKAAEVAQRLEAMLDKAEKPLPEDVLLFELAGVREQLGKTDEAISAYQRIVDEFPRSPYMTEAQQKASALAGPRTTS